MTRRSKIQVTNVFWSLALSVFFISAFLFLLHGSNLVQAQDPLVINRSFEASSALETSKPDPAVVDAILLSEYDSMTTNGFGGRSTVRTLPTGQFPGNYADALSPLSAPIPGGENLVVSMDSDRVWGITGAGETVTVTVNGIQLGAALADNNGFFWTTLYNSSGQKPDLDGGESIAIYHNGALLANTILHAMTANIDVVADDVTGNINVASSMTVTVYPGWNAPNLAAYSKTVTTDGSGDFTVNFSGNWDFNADDRALVAYTANSIEVHQTVYAPRLSMFGFPHNQVSGNGIPGAVITMTLYASDSSTVKQQEIGAAASEESGVYNFADVLMEEGDIVVVDIEGGTILSRTVAALDIAIDADNDRITGVTTPDARITCRLNMLTEYALTQLSIDTTADASGLYTVELSSITDIMPGYWGGCYVHDAEGDDQARWAPAQGLVVVDQTWDEIYGYVPAPSGPLATGRMVTLTVNSHTCGALTTMSKPMDWWGSFYFNVDDGLPCIQPGDTITVESQGYSWQGVVNVDEISVQYDTDNDRFTGEVNSPSDRVELTGQYWNPLSSRNLFPVGGSFDTGVTANSPFTAGTAGFDVRNGVEFAVEHRTADELIDRLSARTDNVRIYTQYNALFATFPPEGTAYTITLREGDGTYKAEITGVSGGPVGDTGYMDFWNQGRQMQPGDYLDIRAANGLSQTLHVPDNMHAVFDADADEISGNGPANTLLFMDVVEQGRGYVPTDGNGNFLIQVGQLQQFEGDGDFREGQEVMICYLVLDGNQVCYSFSWPAIRIDVNYAHQWFEIQTVPDETIYLTLTDSLGAVKGTLFGDSDGGGTFRSYQWNHNWTPEQPVILPGDRVTVTAAGLIGTVNPIGQIDGDPDLDIDIVTGTLNAPWFSPLTLTVSCEVWVENGTGFEIEGVDANGGAFICDFGAHGWDLQPEHDVALRYREPDGDSIINVFRAPWMRVNYGHDWVGGNYPAGHTFWITQTQGGVEKAYATVDSVVNGGWGGTGFETRDEYWTPARPDLVAGDVIIFTSDDGYTNTVTAGEITGFLDSNTDYISGTVNAPWFDPSPLHLICEVWSMQGGRLEQDISADNGTYECDFDGITDIKKGESVAVMYVEPDDGDYVINVFEEPAPDLEVTKWTQGDPAAGGRLTYWIEYWNHGEAEAFNVVMTDTLPANTTYVVDTAPVGALTTGNEVIWDWGTLAPQSNGRFQLVVDIDPGATGTLDNHIEIFTLDDRNPDNNQSDHSIDIQPANVDLWVSKWIHRSEPAPGYNFKYMIQYGNNGPTGSGPVTLTDILPFPTSYVDFYAQDSLWYLVSNDGVEVVLAHPGLAGNSGDQIELTLHLSDTVSIDEVFTNTAMIATTNETGGSDDNFTEYKAAVRDPHMNLGLNKSFAWGTTVADYDVTFRIDYSNHDNVPAYNVLITDTLPAGTTFVESTKQVWNGYNWENVPFPPVQVIGDAVVFDMGTLEPATEGNIFVTVHIDASVAIGTVLTNKAEIGSLGPNDYDEDYFEDNIDTASITVRGVGANLMVIKHDRSQWQGDPQLMIRYDFEVQNIGTVPVSNLKVIDTYPDVTTFNYADLWWGGDIQFQHNAGLHLATWTINETLWPTNGFGGQVTVDLDPDENRGSIFTNTIKILPTTGDIYVKDNTDVEVLTTGPDLYVEKTVPSQWVEAGDLVTFTLHFGNNAKRGEDYTQANVLVTDTLPAGMTYVTSTIRWCGGEGCPYFVPDIQGNKLIFDMGGMCASCWNDIYLTVRVDDQAQPGDSFGNFVEVYSNSPVDDPEGDYRNNTDSATVTVYNPVFEVSKAYETSMVAGTLVTYTLNVTNTGNEGGSGVMLNDTLPTGLTYEGGNGTYGSGAVMWNLGSIEASGGTASGWFNATLPCILDTITNVNYAVTGSDQGAVSDAGPAVTFDVVAPTLGGSFSQSASLVEPNTTVYFSATITTNGTPFTDYAWTFNDPTEVIAGGYANRTFTAEGTFTATFAATDTCGYSIRALGIVTVKTDQVFIYLPLVARNH